jgi:ribose transport system substrate-binding protein
MSEQKKLSRRKFVYAGAAVVAAAAVGGAYYLSQPPTPPTPTATTTTSQPITTGPPSRPMLGLEDSSLSGNEYFVDYYLGVVAAANELGLDLRVVSDDFDSGKFVHDLQDLTNLGCKMMNVMALDEYSIITARDICINAQAYFGDQWMLPQDNHEDLMKNVPWDPRFGGYFVRNQEPNTYVDYWDLSHIAFNYIGRKGKVAHIEGAPGMDCNEFRNMALYDTLKEYPDIQVIEGEAAVYWDLPSGRKSMEAILTTHPDVKAVLTQSNSIAIGARMALEAKGLTNVPIFAGDDSSQALEMMKDDKIILQMGFFTPFQGGSMTVALYDALNGHKFTPDEQLVFNPTVILTKLDVDELYPDHIHKVMDWQEYYSEIFGDAFKARGNKWPWDFRKMSYTVAEQEGFEVDPRAGWKVKYGRPMASITCGLEQYLKARIHVVDTGTWEGYEGERPLEKPYEL